MLLIGGWQAIHSRFDEVTHFQFDFIRDHQLHSILEHRLELSQQQMDCLLDALGDLAIDALVNAFEVVVG